MKTSYLPALKQVICEDNIPSTLGGKCTCYSSPEINTCCTGEGCTELPELQKMDDYIMREHQKEINGDKEEEGKPTITNGPPAHEVIQSTTTTTTTFNNNNIAGNSGGEGMTHIVSQNDMPVVETTNQYVDNNQILQQSPPPPPPPIQQQPIQQQQPVYENVVYYEQQQQPQQQQQQPYVTTTNETVDSKKFMPASLGVKDVNGNYVISQQQMDPQQYNRIFMD